MFSQLVAFPLFIIKRLIFVCSGLHPAAHQVKSFRAACLSSCGNAGDPISHLPRNVLTECNHAHGYLPGSTSHFDKNLQNYLSIYQTHSLPLYRGAWLSERPVNAHAHSTDHGDVPPPSVPARMSWARLLTKPPGAFLNGERRRYGIDYEVGHDDRDARISSYLLRVARIKGGLKIEMDVTIVVEEDGRHPGVAIC